MNEIPDPADELRGDIEAAIEQQEKERGIEPELDGRVAESGPEREVKEGETSPERDEKGRFKPKDEQETAESELAPVAGKAVEAKEPDSVPELGAIVQRPPPGFSVASKAEWDNLPQHVRDDIAKREQEIGTGLQRYSGLKSFAEEAERNGTTIQNAVSDYVAVETALRRDPVSGIEFLSQKLGFNPRALAWAMSQRYGIAVNNEAGIPASVPAPQQQVDPQAIADYVMNLSRTEAQQREIDSKIEVFAADPKNKYFPNLRQDMAQIVNAGKATNLQEAYEAACWLNPEIRATLISEANGGANKQAAATATKARNAAKAIGGSPSDGVNPDAGGRKDMSIQDTIRAAIAAQEGAA